MIFYYFIAERYLKNFPKFCNENCFNLFKYFIYLLSSLSKFWYESPELNPSENNFYIFFYLFTGFNFTSAVECRSFLDLSTYCVTWSWYSYWSSSNLFLLPSSRGSLWVCWRSQVTVCWNRFSRVYSIPCCNLCSCCCGTQPRVSGVFHNPLFCWLWTFFNR